MTRRNLLTTTGAVAITAASQSRILGANDRMSVALIGCGARGNLLLSHFQKLNNAPLTAVCDVYRMRAEQALALAPGAKLFGDHRKVLEMPGVDAVIVATPDHWHAPIAIDALNAGKDVYVEKPLTFTMEEGPRIIRAARVNDRICQVGAQQRSGTHYLQARDEYLRTGKLGKIYLVRTWWTDGGSGIGTPVRANAGSNASGVASARPANAPGGHGTPPDMREKPSDLDWNRYLGRARWRAWDPPQYFNFRNYRDFGGGILTVKFVHWVDVVHMFMEQDGPITADNAGGLFYAKDGRNVQDTINLHLEYPGQWICTYTNTAQAGFPREGIEFCGTNGHLRIDRTKFEYFSAERGAAPLVEECHTDLVAEHVQDFLDSCRSRKLPRGDVAFGHRSAQAAHLGNLSYDQKRRIHFDPDREIVLL
jgi:predicted dehydrogenase